MHDEARLGASAVASVVIFDERLGLVTVPRLADLEWSADLLLPKQLVLLCTRVRYP